jgi:hypothetical protein
MGRVLMGVGVVVMGAVETMGDASVAVVTATSAVDTLAVA